CTPGGTRAHTGRVGMAADPFSPAVPSKGGLRWRRLAVEVTPEHIRVLWDDQRQQIDQSHLGRVVPAVGRPELQRMTAQLMQTVGDPFVVDPELSPWHGLGLFVYRSVASFRFVEIEPLTEDN